MSDRSQALPTPEGEYFESNRFAGLSALLGSIALVALGLSIVGTMIDPHVTRCDRASSRNATFAP